MNFLDEGGREGPSEEVILELKSAPNLKHDKEARCRKIIGPAQMKEIFQKA